MRDGEPSGTARHVAAYRVGFDRPPVAFGDPEAEDRLARDVAAGTEIDPTARIADYLRARTSFFDRVVLSALDSATTQVAVIGAGYDARALRYAKPGVRWFEVDHPATQRDKRQRLDRLAIATPGITFVAADLAEEDISTVLPRAGFRPGTPSLLLCEGLAVYLAPAVLARLLAGLRSIATPDTRLAISTGIPGIDPARRAQFAARVAALGEPAALADADIGALLTAAQWRPAELPEPDQRVGVILAIPA
ncbi:MAG TPA: SAM-dependent methyltransferase [Pseudonocardia sp.]|jgi:methyltransferase (TIGR00027 family)|uniref:class I SAM-dependent methyltransferase n=1 Tax=Pseudonocardia sp. TaxID=60912 RepID=UPI002F41F8BB